MIAISNTTGSALVAKAATESMPIVFNIGSEPVAMGLIATFSRPGKNVIGVAMPQTGVAAKRLELLHELASTDRSIAILVNPSKSGFAQADAKEAQQAARTLFHGGIEHAWFFLLALTRLCGGKLG